MRKRSEPRPPLFRLPEQLRERESRMHGKVGSARDASVDSGTHA